MATQVVSPTAQAAQERQRDALARKYARDYERYYKAQKQVPSVYMAMAWDENYNQGKLRDLFPNDKELLDKALYRCYDDWFRQYVFIPGKNDGFVPGPVPTGKPRHPGPDSPPGERTSSANATEYNRKAWVRRAVAQIIGQIEVLYTDAGLKEDAVNRHLHYAHEQAKLNLNKKKPVRRVK